MSRRMPLELKLPLLMSAILATVLAIALAATYASLRSSALERAHDRVRRATRQFAAVTTTGIVTQNSRYSAVANDSAIRRTLRGSDDSVAVKSALARLSFPNDSGMPVELWAADGRRMAFVGNDVRTTMILESGRPELPERISVTIDPVAGSRADTILRIGPLYSEGSRVHFWFVMPVRDRGRLLGFITHQRRIAQNAQTAQTLRELAGDSVAIYYRNLDGSFWVTAGGTPLAPYVNADPRRGTASTARGDRLVYNEERVAASPLMIGMSMPEAVILQRASGPVGTIAILSLLLVLGGGFAAWLIGRSVAHPLGEMTRAARLVAMGDYAARVPEQGDPEVRRLAETFNHMATEIGASRAALERQTKEATAANNAKSEFLTTMSHELRTPLNAIGGYVDLIEMELRGPVTPAQRRDLERIKASQEHLLGLISGVLDLARVESGKVNYDLVDVAVDPFLSGLDALIEPQAAAKSVALQYVPCPPDLTVVADREKLRQILLNLLSNAIRHTPAGGNVTLSAEQLGGRVQIAVQDTGPGVPEEKYDEIFEPFVQLDRSLSQIREGLGLGLAISRDLARGMSGDLTVDRHAGPGARFVLALNRGTANAAKAMALSGLGTRD